MPQLDFLRSIDDQIMGVMLGAGLADSAVYDAGAGTVSCRVYVDRDVEIFGDDQAGVAGVQTLVTLFLAEVPAPQRGATITIGAEVFELAELQGQDESRSRWVVVRG